MGALNWLVLLLTHPLEFRTLAQFWLYHEKKRDIKALKEHATSGWDRASMRRCWEFLDMTSRSFAAVIKELDGDLARTICMFYLVLRGLDTIEDDMTIPDDVKQPILRSFHEYTQTPGWKYDGCGPNEKDRQLLVEYDTVVEEVNLLAPHYKSIIIDICHKMQTGMADYAHNAATTGSIYLSTTAEYDLYCHYVAGLVGEGLSRIFAASGKEEEWLGEQLELSNSMGLLLQKTNIIRDYREDTDDQRYFWPREIWGKYGFKEMKEMYALDADTAKRAQWVQSAMILDALRHAEDALDYLKLLKNQTVFNFCAIPATMAMATLELCYMNPEMFQRNIKIRKAEAARLIMRSTNPREVGLLFRHYARLISAKSQASPTDPNYLRIAVACGRIEQWCEHNYPSFIRIVEPTTEGGRPRPEIDAADTRSRVFAAQAKRNTEIAKKLKAEGVKGVNTDLLLPEVKEAEMSTGEVIMYVGAAMAAVLLFAGAIVFVILQMSDEGSPLRKTVTERVAGLGFGEL